jgi:hypothetical protein
MPRYKATFKESCTYFVEFESDETIDAEDDDSWFDALEAADPRWLVAGPKTQSEVDDRELIELVVLDGTGEQHPFVFAMPLAEALNAWLDADDRLRRGDARLFSPEEWNARGEGYGTTAELTLIIDGSPLFAALNYSEPRQYYRELERIARRHGFWFELGHAWSVHFYRLPEHPITGAV